MKHNHTLNYIYIILLVLTSLYIFWLLWNDRKYVEFENDVSQYYQNQHWMFNANVFQYSSYIIISNSSHYLIETLIFVNNAPIKDVNINYFQCFIQAIKTSQLFEIKVVATYRLVLDHIHKVVCSFDRILLQEGVKDLAVAVVVKRDFEINANLKSTKFPLSMVNFQIPSIINEEYPRLKKVGVCVNFVSRTYQGIFNWLQMQELFEASTVVMHDGTHNSLRNLVYPKFNPNFVEIRDYNIDESSICYTDLINAKMTANPSNAAIYKSTCTQFLRTIFSDYGSHNHLSVNDCYASFYYRYEFVTLYDLDELILPRANNVLDIAKSKQKFECSNLKNVCSYKPIMNIYDYINDLVKKEFKHDIKKLRSIAFHHSVFFMPSADVQSLLMENLKIIVNKIKINQNFYPFILNTDDKYGFRHSFIINEVDKDYAVYLAETYDEIKCLFDKYISNKNLHHQWIRYVYFHTHFDQRFPKSIHYTQNVQGLFTHDAAHYTKDSIILNPSKENGHMNSHYRDNINVFFGANRNFSIINFGIDFDYILFLLQEFTSTCFN